MRWSKGKPYFTHDSNISLLGHNFRVQDQDALDIPLHLYITLLNYAFKSNNSHNFGNIVCGSLG